MAQNSREFGYNMEGSSQHIHWEHNMAQGSVGESLFPGGQNAVQEARSPSISRTTSSKKSFRQGFLNWVAFERSLSPNISDLVKRTCPVAECEKCLGSELQMRQHLKGCLHLEKGFYRCHETDKIEQIGKCETKGCRELRQYKSLFSNAMHTLGRRLSPRGCRPSRLVNKISKKYSQSPHMFGVDPRIPYSEPDWESTMDNSDVIPEYTPFYSKSTQHYVTELSSDREVVELPANHRFAEPYAGHVTTTPEYFEQPQPTIAELGVAGDDSTQVSQFLAHGTYQPAELCTATDSVFERQNVQVDGWDLTPSNYDTTPEALLNMYCSNDDLFMTDAPTMDARCQQTPQTSNVTQPYDCTELVSPVKEGDCNGRFPCKSNVSPMGSFTESDVNQGNSVVSASPSRSTSGTSVSIIDPIKTPPDSTPATFLAFFDEPDRMFQDPIEDFEPLPSTKNLMNNPQASFHSFNEPVRAYQEPIEEEFHLSEAMSMSTNQSTPSTLASPWSSGSNSTTDQSSSSSSGCFSDMLHQEFQTQYQSQLTSETELLFQLPMPVPRRQIQRKPVASSSPRDDLPVQRLSPDIDYSIKVTAPAQSSSKETPYQCRYCPQCFTDKSNRNRHVSFSCKKRPDYNPDKEKRPFKCNFGACRARFTQRYNLLAHQKTQGHLPPARIASLHQSPWQTVHHSLGLQRGRAHP